MSNELRKLPDAELLSATKSLVARELELTTLVIRYFEEIERRKLYAFRYSSLFDYATKELKYSEGAAQRRIDAMRLIREMPEAEAKIASGALSLSNISQAQRYFRDMKKAAPEQPI